MCCVEALVVSIVDMGSNWVTEDTIMETFVLRLQS